MIPKFFILGLGAMVLLALLVVALLVWGTRR
jgi:hypothetical protein